MLMVVLQALQTDPGRSFSFCSCSVTERPYTFTHHLFPLAPLTTMTPVTKFNTTLVHFWNPATVRYDNTTAHHNHHRNYSSHTYCVLRDKR
jgi:hypothetical protein